MTVARFAHSATLLPDGRVLIAGGSSGFSAELYDPSSGTFTATGDMVNAGVNGTAILLANGKVLIAHDLSPYAAAATAELYDPVTGTFSATGNQLLIWSGDQKAALLADGRVLLMICCTAEQLYDPASGTFSLTGRTTRVYPDGFAAAPLANGKVLLSGGYAEEVDVVTAGAELYDPSTGTFVPTGNMTMPRYYHTATPLGDGTVMIAGGGSSGYLPDIASASAELYDPATGAFSRTGDMTTARRNHTATLLHDEDCLDLLARIGVWPARNSITRLYPFPRLCCSPCRPTGKGKARSGTPRQDRSHRPTILPSPAKRCPCTPPAWLTAVWSLRKWPSAAGWRKSCSSGDAPGYPGYYQVNFRLPSSVASGSAVPVRLIYFNRPSNQVTIGAQ